MILVNAERARNPGEGSARGWPEPPPNDPTPSSHPLFAKDLFISLTPPLPAQPPSLSQRPGRTVQSPRRFAGGLGRGRVGGWETRTWAGLRGPRHLWAPRAALSGWREGQPAPRPSCPFFCLALQPPPSPASSRGGAAGRGKGRGWGDRGAVGSPGEDPESRGGGGRRAGGCCCVSFGVSFSQASP